MNFFIYLWEQTKLIFSYLSLINYKQQCPVGFVGDNCEIECGLGFKNPINQKIVGGNESIPNAWPSQIYFDFRYRGYMYLDELNDYTYVNVSYSYLCGGSLIDLNTILTAAHCIITSTRIRINSTRYNVYFKPNDPNSLYSVYLGVHNKSSITENYPNRREVKKVIMHEFYESFSNLNDIALFKLSTPAVLGSSVQVACLPTYPSKSYPKPDQTAWVVGWGVLNDVENIQPDVLMQVKLTVYNNSMCRNVLPLAFKFWNLQICAGAFEGGKDTCQGDSGGPLFVSDFVGEKLKFIIAGITSYGDGCAKQGLPGIYTRTSAYLEWINRKK